MDGVSLLMEMSSEGIMYRYKYFFETSFIIYRVSK